MPGLPSVFKARVNSGPNYGVWTQVGYRYGVNDQGAYQEYTERGPGALVDQDMQNFFIPNGWTCDVTSEKAGFKLLVARAGWFGNPGVTDWANELAGNIWEMEPSRTDKSLLDADFPFGTLNMNIEPIGNCLGSAGSRQAIRAALDDSNPIWGDAGGGVFGVVLSNMTCYVFDDGSEPPYAPTVAEDGYTYFSCPSADAQIAFTLYKIMHSGVTSFPVSSRTIKHTQLFSSQYETLVSYANVDRVISSASMVNVEGANDFDPAVWTVPQYNPPVNYVASPGDLQYGWLKETPEVSRISNCKWRTVNRYQFGLWLTQLYGQVL